MSELIDKIAVLGQEFTIQTEYIPGDTAKIRTLVYDGGRLVSSREISSSPTIDIGDENDAAVRLQHDRITETLIERAAEFQAAKTTQTAPPPAPPPGAGTPPPSVMKIARPRVEPGSYLGTAITVRRIIGPFSLAFASPAPTTAEDFRQSLDGVDAAIDAIRAAPSYDAIRLDEQLTLIALKSQLEAWRMADCDLAMATQIWLTVERFAHHLQKINHRRDLVAFDHQLLTWAIGELGKGAITDEMIGSLTALGGRDEELDRFLWNPAGTEPFGLLEILLRLLDQTLV